MRSHYKNSWKQKIDPAFDKLVQVYVDSLEQLERNPMEGKLNFPPNLIEPIIEKSGWQEPYDSDLSNGKDLFSFIVKTGALEKSDIAPFFEIISLLETEEHKALLETCATLIKALPEAESRKFYIDSLQPYKDASDPNAIIGSSDKDYLDFYSIIISLATRYLFVKLFDEDKPVIDEQIEYFKSSNAALSFLNVILTMFSQLANQMTLMELKENIVKGDDKAIFKAVTIDKSVLYLEEVKAKVQTAQLAGDSKFFAKLGKAIADNPLKRIGQHGKTYAVLKMFWFHGLYKLTNEELYDFLKSCGLIPRFDASLPAERSNLKSVESLRIGVPKCFV